jgi:diadenosine tetraphosphate (Ap4A) HIT family hydrolase
VVELERHALGLADLTPEEAAALGPLLRQVCAALLEVTRAERIYTLMTVEGEPHAHLWLVPRPAKATARGLAYLDQDLQCGEDEALTMAEWLRAALGV